MPGAVPEERLRLVSEKTKKWAERLIDLSSHNPLLYFKNSKFTTLDLTDSEPDAFARLSSGRKTRLRELFSETASLRDAVARMGGTRGMRNKIKAFAEEQGIDVGKLAYGFIRATSPSASAGSQSVKPSRAPLLLRSFDLQATTKSGDDFALTLDDDIVINPVLLYALVAQYGADFDVAEMRDEAERVLAESEDPVERLDHVYELLEKRVRGSGVSLELERRFTMGLFNYEKQPMVEDLKSATELLADHDIVAAVAGHAPATEQIWEAADTFEPPEPNEIPPQQEFLVHDADSSQQQVVAAALAGHHVLVEGPPGTGKSQTIANIIAGAAALGKRVLFVAEKRAAIEAVTTRLAKVGLNELVFDLHQKQLGRKQVAQQLQKSLDASSRQTRPDVEQLYAQLPQRRQDLLEKNAELHRVREPWGLSAYQVQSELLENQQASTPPLFRGSVLERLDKHTVRDLESKLQRFVEIGGLRVIRDESPWSKADITTEDDIRRVLAELDELTSTVLDRGQNHMDKVLRQTGLKSPSEYAGWHEVLELLDGVNRCVRAFGPDVFSTELDDWWYATATRAQRRLHPRPLSWLQRRSILKRVRRSSRDGITVKAALNEKLTEAVKYRDRWTALSEDPHGKPSEVVGLQETMDLFSRLRTQLASVAMCARLSDVEHKPTGQVRQHLDALQEDKQTLFDMVEINQKRSDFHVAGLSGFLEDVAERRLDSDAEAAQLLFRHTWLKSLHDEFMVSSSALRGFSVRHHSRLLDEYRDFDAQHRDISAERVQWEVARNLRKTLDAYPHQRSLVRTEAEKKARHMSARRLVEKAPDVLLAVHPCWAMSPLVVSRMLPAQQLFDIVIFDEASQIEPHDAVATIARGKQLVVAGDDNQLPPTDFFKKMLTGADTDDDEDSEEGEAQLEDYESILTTMRPLIPNQKRLRWHYRSTDERLIAFSNHEIYDNDLVTFPGTNTDPPVRLEVVPGVVGPGAKGSSPVEVERVVELVLEHAEFRPGETLGVITLGATHADKVKMALARARKNRPELEEFFSDHAEPGTAFFVKNIEQVQGDERDAIILSVGVAKRASGVVNLQGFAALNREGSQRRVNVAITRAKRRMTVVSSFGPEDLSPDKVKWGTALLRQYLEFARNGGHIDRVGRGHSATLNGFERDVERALLERGIEVHPQWGFSSYRIDFALAHPHRPGQMVLAVEADGDTYHRAHSARDRDRLRQNHLEALGWRFHRVWASAWFADRQRETEKIVEAWEKAVLDSERAADDPDHAQVTRGAGRKKHRQSEKDAPVARRGPRPDVPRKMPTEHYTHQQLLDLCRWLFSDGLQLDREQRLEQALRELSKRRGAKIVQCLLEAIDSVQSECDWRDS